jgi:hypothetical protein
MAQSLAASGFTAVITADTLREVPKILPTPKFAAILDEARTRAVSRITHMAGAVAMQ